MNHFHFDKSTASLLSSADQIFFYSFVGQITTDGRHVYLLKAGWLVGTAWVCLATAQHWFTIVLLIIVESEDGTKAQNCRAAFFLFFSFFIIKTQKIKC